MTSPSDELDPGRLEAASFDVVRRGFEPDAVRDRLREAAQEIRRLRRERDELAGRLAEFDDANPGSLEAHRVAEALGVEATQVLESAHQAARERAERAEREAEAVRDEALAAAETIRREAEEARDELIEAARTEADEIVEEGRVRGRDMVTEAQTVRERMLRDLARRRQTGRAQVEQLKAGRDRLLESLSVAQQTLDTAVDDLVESVPEARAAAERAGLRVTSEPETTVGELEGEIEAARLVGHPLVEGVAEPGDVEDAFTTGEMETLPHLEVLGEGESGVGSEAEEAGQAEETDRADEAEATVEEVEEAEAEDADQADGTAQVEEGEIKVEVDAEPEAADEPVVELYDVEAEEGIEVEAVDVEDTSEDTSEDTGEETAEGEPDGDVSSQSAPEAAADDVFARLRSSQAAQAETVLEAADRAAAAVAEADTGADTTTTDEPEEPGETRDEGAQEAGALQTETVVEEGGLDPGRAAARDRAAADAARAMKKVLVEEQGMLLDGIRRSGAAALAGVVDDPAAHDAAYDEAATSALKELAAELGGSRRLGLGPALDQIHTIALEPVRQRLAEVSDRVEDADELSDTVRALYRESRSRRIPEAAAAAAVAVDGLVAIATADGALQWRMQPGGPCGPDCADNELAGEIPAGEEYPTGHRHPPAHDACTCWLEAASG